MYTDTSSLKQGDKWWGFDKYPDFMKWYHKHTKPRGGPDATQEEMKEHFEDWKNQGKPDAEGHRQNYVIDTTTVAVTFTVFVAVVAVVTAPSWLPIVGGWLAAYSVAQYVGVAAVAISGYVSSQYVYSTDTSTSA